MMFKRVFRALFAVVLFAAVPAPAAHAGGVSSGAAPGAVTAIGPKGDAGCSILPTVGAPPAGLGADCDFAFDAAAGKIYGPKLAGQWGQPVTLGPVFAAQSFASAAQNHRNAAETAAASASASAGAAAASATQAQAYATGFSVGTVTTLAPGAGATAAISGAPGAQHLDLGIPQGPVGPQGPTGATGPQGPASVNFTTRQTVAAGPVDASGFPSFLPATSASLSITTQNVSASTPLIVTAAQGFDASGKIDYASQFAANQTWGSLPASSTLYLYVNAQTGALGFTSLVPIYQHGGTPSATNGQFTFNISEMRGYLGNGSTAPATPIVFIGEVVTNASSVTSAVAYAYNGRFEKQLDSGWSWTSSLTHSVNSNIGCMPLRAEYVLRNISGVAQEDVPAGGEVRGPLTGQWYGTPTEYTYTLTVSRNALAITMGNNGLIMWGWYGTINDTNYALIFRADRGW